MTVPTDTEANSTLLASRPLEPARAWKEMIHRYFVGGLGTLILGSTLQCLALLFYLPFNGLTSLYLVSALFGLSQGGIVPSYALIVRQYFPAREAGARVSLVLMTSVVGMAAGGWISGKIFDLTGSYQAAFLNGVAWNLLNMAIAFWLLLGRLRPRPSLA